MKDREPHDDRRKNAIKAAIIGLIFPMPWGIPHAGGGIAPAGFMLIVALQNLMQGRNGLELWALALVMWAIPFVGSFIVFELFRKWNERKRPD